MGGSGPPDPGSNPGRAIFKYSVRFCFCMSKNKSNIVNNMGSQQLADLLLRLSNKRRMRVLDSMNYTQLINVLHYLDPDEITDILYNLSPRKKNKILNLMSDDIKEKVEYLLRFDPRTAAGLMNLNYVIVHPDTSFRDIAKILKKHEKKTGKIPEILVINKNGTLLGELPSYTLALHKDREKIKKYIKKIHTIPWNANKHEVIHIFRKYKHNKVVVLDEDKTVIGLIYSDDVLSLLHEEASKSIYHLASVSEEEDVMDPFWEKIKHRYGWLIINLFTEFLAAFVVSLFQNSINAIVLLAVYMPMVAGMGGNAATQTLAVIVRGLALNEIKKGVAIKILINEIMSGVVNGLITGIIVAFVAFFISKSPLIGVAVTAAMIINLIVAAVFGTIIPLIMKKLGKDPASSATIFITTATDVFGFLSFLGIATLLMG